MSRSSDGTAGREFQGEEHVQNSFTGPALALVVRTGCRAFPDGGTGADNSCKAATATAQFDWTAVSMPDATN